jgi:alkanesulfonate monooxygenase SsuD/methylene tetrahydromethanopterin reductase-like flavin-dependent oxidoreductase (luciferase family)
MIEQLKADSFESNLASGAAWVGTPKQIVKQINAYRRDVGEFEIASLQVNFNTIPFAEAKASMELFAREVIPAVI